MLLSATTILLALRLVAAAPRHEIQAGNTLVTVEIATGPLQGDVVHASRITEHGIDKYVHVDVTSGAQASLKDVTAMEEKIPGWLFIDGKRFQARVHGNTFWNIKGELDETFPLDGFLFDPLIFSLNHPKEFDGKFNGTMGEGEISLKWESGATIFGRSSVGDYKIEGKTHVDWSP